MNLLASMEPCLFRHGKSFHGGAERGKSGLQWSHVFSDMVRVAARLFAPVSCIVLQWSHVFSDMVSPGDSHTCRRCRRASMEPCLFRHGKAAADMVSAEGARASMEPCLFRHGKIHIEASATTDDRREASMEPCLFRHGKRVAGPDQSGPGDAGFNGAMSFQTW